MNKHGRVLKTIPPFNRIFPYVMKRRNDSMVFAREVVVMEPLEQYLLEQSALGKNINYLHIFMAVYVRVLAQRPWMNRYIQNSKVYARNEISISMAVKKNLTDEGEETTVKFVFKGTETIHEIAKIVNDTIEAGIKQDENSDGVDKIVNMITRLPGIIKKSMVGALLILDKYDLLPAGILKASPFHASVFLSYLKSIKLPYVYHHLYDLGTTSVFIAIGMTVELPVVVNGKLEVKRAVEVGYTVDERICDGFYLGKTFRLAKQYLNDPHLLEVPLEKITSDVQ